MTMITANKLHDFVTMSIASGQSQSTHGSLCTRVYHADNLNRWINLHNLLGQLGLNQGRCTIAGTSGSSLLQSLYHLWMSMAHHHRPPGAYIINIIIAVNIIDMTALCSSNERRVAIHTSIGTNRTINATWHQLFGLSKSRRRFFKIQHANFPPRIPYNT